MNSPRPALSRAALIQVLVTIQNSPFYAHQDILTFTGLCTTAEVADHVWACFRPLPEADKVRALETLQAHVAPVAA